MNWKKSLVILMTLILVFTLSVSTTLAASVHLKGGKNAKPAFFDHGLSLSAEGELSGIGEGDVIVFIDATAAVVSTCTNNGGNAAPGQNPAPIDVSGSSTITPDERLKNGNTPFTVETEPPPPYIEGAPDCPNPNWVETIDDLLFTSATITVEQGGVIVFSITCTFSTPTSDGAVQPRDVNCN